MYNLFSRSFGTQKTNTVKHGFYLALTSGNFFLANASELEYENLFIFSASYCSISKDYRLVSARWKPFLALHYAN